MKKIAILSMSLLLAGALFAQTPQAPAKKEVTKTEKKCCGDKKECAEKKGEKKCCAEKKAEKKACCAEKKAEKKADKK